MNPRRIASHLALRSFWTSLSPHVEPDRLIAMLPAPNNRLLLTLAITAAVAVSATVLSCSDESSLGPVSAAPNTVQDPTVASCDPLMQSSIGPCESEVDDGKESSPYLHSLATNSYLVGTVEPCGPLPQSEVDPCARRFDDWDIRISPYIQTAMMELEGPPTIETVLSERYFSTSFLIPHIVVRGTVIPGTTRCGEADRFLLTAFREDPYVDEHQRDTCFSDLRVNEYIVGRGPSRLTVNVGDHFKVDALFDDSASYYEWLESIHSVFEGSEWVVGLLVSLDAAFSAWRISDRPWDLQKREDGTLVVVDWMARTKRRHGPLNDNGFEMTLDGFRDLVRRMHRDYVESNRGRIGDFEGAPFVLNDANHEFIHAYMSSAPVFSIVDATPRAAPPPPSRGSQE